MKWHERLVLTNWVAPRTVDALLVVGMALTVSCLATFFPSKGSEQSADLLAYVLVLGSAATLWWRRTNPLVALPVCIGFTVSFWILDYSGAIDPIMWTMFFSATRHGGHDRRRVWQVVATCIVLIIAVATVGVIVPTEDLPLVALPGIFVVHGTAAAVGEALYQRSQHVSELEQRAAALEADMENKAALAAVEERTRIAREMHDIIAHGMSAIVVQASAGQRVADDPDRSRDVFTTIEGIGRESVHEMRRMLGVLRDNSDGAAREPQPGLEDFRDLGFRATEAGVDTSMEVYGEQRTAPPGVELTAYRVIQEALTNVVRHAGRPVRADVEITYSEASIEVSIIDDGLGAAAAHQTGGSGLGLLGMRERVEIYNGTFRAGPQAGGGFEVHVSLPIPARVPS